MLKRPLIKKEISDVSISNGEHFDIYTVNHREQENTGYVKVYVSELGKVRIYIDKHHDVEVLDWKGAIPFNKQVREDIELHQDEEEKQ